MRIFISPINSTNMRWKWGILIIILLGSNMASATQQYQITGEFRRSDGTTGSLQSYNGTYLLFNAMNTSCVSCGDEMSHLQDVYTVINNRSDVKILTMSMDTDTDTIQKLANFMSKYNATWDYGVDYKHDYLKYFNISTFPTTILLGPTGHILKKWVGLTSSDSFLGELDTYLTGSTSAQYKINGVYTLSNGMNGSLQSYNGTYLLLDAMATWCGPCRVEMLHLQDVYDVIKGREDVKLLSMSMDNETDSIQKLANFMNKYDAKWSYGFDFKHDYFHYFNVTGYPTTILLGPTGQILKTWLGLTTSDVILHELDNYLNLPGAFIRDLKLNQLFDSLLHSPFFYFFLILVWIFILLSGIKIIKLVAGSPDKNKL